MIKSTRQIMEDIVNGKMEYIKPNDKDRLFTELLMYYKKGDKIMTGKILDVLHSIYLYNLKELTLKRGIEKGLDPEKFKKLSLYQVLDIIDIREDIQ